MNKKMFLIFLFLFVNTCFASWRDQPLYRYEDIDPNITKDQLQGISYKDSGELQELLKKHSNSDKAELFIPMNKDDLPLLSFAAATSLGLVVFKNDENIREVVQRNADKVPQGLMNFGYTMGYKTGIAPIAVGSYFLGLVFDNDRLAKVGLIIVAAEAATGIVTEGIKEIFGRMRPSQTTGGAYEFFVKGNYKSFFSGHSSAAFSLATVISEAFGDDYPYIPYIAYGVATITAFSRIHADAHWASDVLLGAIAGHLITKIVYKILMTDQKDIPESKRWLSISPEVDFRNGGFKITVNYVPKAWRPRVR